jgi:hypothetical protein
MLAALWQESLLLQQLVALAFWWCLVAAQCFTMVKHLKFSRQETLKMRLLV